MRLPEKHSVREIVVATAIFLIAAIVGATMLSCVPPNTGMPEGQYAILPPGSVMCERKQAVKNYIDDKIEGKDGMIRLLMERRRIPGAVNYSVPTCHVVSTTQRILRVWGEPVMYEETGVFLRKVSLRGSIVNFWTIQSFIEWGQK